MANRVEQKIRMKRDGMKMSMQVFFLSLSSYSFFRTSRSNSRKENVNLTSRSFARVHTINFCLLFIFCAAKYFDRAPKTRITFTNNEKQIRLRTRLSIRVSLRQNISVFTFQKKLFVIFWRVGWFGWLNVERRPNGPTENMLYLSDFLTYILTFIISY